MPAGTISVFWEHSKPVILNHRVQDLTFDSHLEWDTNHCQRSEIFRMFMEQDINWNLHVSTFRKLTSEDIETAVKLGLVDLDPLYTALGFVNLWEFKAKNGNSCMQIVKGKVIDKLVDLFNQQTTTLGSSRGLMALIKTNRVPLNDNNITPMDGVEYSMSKVSYMELLAAQQELSEAQKRLHHDLEAHHQLEQELSRRELQEELDRQREFNVLKTGLKATKESRRDIQQMSEQLHEKLMTFNQSQGHGQENFEGQLMLPQQEKRSFSDRGYRDMPVPAGLQLVRRESEPVSLSLNTFNVPASLKSWGSLRERAFSRRQNKQDDSENLLTMSSSQETEEVLLVVHSQKRHRGLWTSADDERLQDADDFPPPGSQTPPRLLEAPEPLSSQFDDQISDIFSMMDVNKEHQ